MWQQLDCSADSRHLDESFRLRRAVVPLGRSHRGRRHQRRDTAVQTSAPNTRPLPSPPVKVPRRMGFYNVQQGDAPYFKSLADNYAMSDNFHQSVNGGTGANHIMLGHGDAIWFSDGNGNATGSASQRRSCRGNRERRRRGRSRKSRIPPSAPTTGTPKTATAAAPTALPSYGGGSYTDCADTTQPGVAPIVNYLQVASASDQPELRAGPLLSAQQLQSGLLRQRQQRLHRHQRRQHRIHHSTLFRAEHRRRPQRHEHFLEVLRRSVE